MHDKDVPAQTIAGKITETAAGVGVNAEKLGLSHQTVPAPVDADASALRDLMRNMRQNLSGRNARKSPGGFMDRMKSLVGMKLGA
jgi:hypothetical protein